MRWGHGNNVTGADAPVVTQKEPGDNRCFLLVSIDTMWGQGPELADPIAFSMEDDLVPLSMNLFDGHE